jgi:hypothetical protein
MRLPLASRITTRDGTLTKDSKMVNCYLEQSPDGGVNVVKRPGTTITQQLTAGTAQGVFATGGVPWGIVTDTIQQLAGGTVSRALGTPVTAGLRMQCTDMNYLVSGPGISAIKSTKALWQFDINSLIVTRNVDADYPALTVTGVAYLDGTYYVMSPAGVIYGSDIENPMSWNALNFIATDRGLGLAVSIHRHLNYVLALCDFGLQFFYDAANATGSPLLPMPNSACTVGCATGDSVVSINDMTIFMSKNKQRGRSISCIAGLSVSVLSTPFVDKILNLDDLANVYAYGVKSDGHSFYVLTLLTSNLTLVCDLTTQEWTLWASGATGANAFNGAFYVHAEGNSPSNLTQDLLLNRTTGAVYSFLNAAYTDAESAIAVLVRTPILDRGTIDPKRISRINLIGDTVASSVAVTYSRDDYTTFSSSRTIDMSTERKVLARIGRYRRLSFDISHTAATPLRLKAIEIHAEDGQELQANSD